jgi:hypothetical protein
MVLISILIANMDKIRPISEGGSKKARQAGEK